MAAPLARAYRARRRQRRGRSGARTRRHTHAQFSVYTIRALRIRAPRGAALRGCRAGALSRPSLRLRANRSALRLPEIRSRARRAAGGTMERAVAGGVAVSRALVALARSARRSFFILGVVLSARGDDRAHGGGAA